MTQSVESRERGARNPAGGWPAVPEGYRATEMYRAVSDACYVYRYRDLEHNLWKFGWRQARKRILRHGALSGEWENRGHGELRLGVAPRVRGFPTRHSKRRVGGCACGPDATRTSRGCAPGLGIGRRSRRPRRPGTSPWLCILPERPAIPPPDSLRRALYSLRTASSCLPPLTLLQCRGDLRPPTCERNERIVRDRLE